MFNDISCGTKDNERECLANAKLVSPVRGEDLEKDNGHSLVHVPKRSGILWKRTAHKEFRTVSRKRCWWNSPKADVRFSVLRHQCPEVNSEAKDKENCRFTLLPTKKQLRLLHNCFCKSAQSIRSSRKHV